MVSEICSHDITATTGENTASQKYRDVHADNRDLNLSEKLLALEVSRENSEQY